MTRLQLAAGAVVGGLAVFLIMMAVNSLWLIPAAKWDARQAERAEMDAATNKAIGELANEADRARVNRRLCRERGGVYLNGSGQCIKAAPQPGG